MGLYGTKCCNYYHQRYQQAGGAYYRSISSAICNAVPKPPGQDTWSNCVRKYLQHDKATLEAQNGSLKASRETTSIVGIGASSPSTTPTTASPSKTTTTLVAVYDVVLHRCSRVC
jgi:hypothetical protein